MGDGSKETQPGKLFTQVSRGRVEARSLLGALKKLGEAAKPTGQATSTPSVARGALGDAVTAWYAALETAEVGRRAKEIEAVLNGEEDLHRYAEGGWGAVNGFSRLLDRWPGEPKQKHCSDEDPARTLVKVEESTAILDEVIFECCKVTIPDEVEEMLRKIRIGKTLDFHTVFDDTLSNAAQRKEILELLKHRQIGGWVDPATGLIYSISRSKGARAITCVAPFVVALLVGAALYGVSSLSIFDSWTFLNDGWELVGAYGLVLAGATFHLLVENLKASQTKLAPVLAVTDFVYWLNLRWVGLLATILWVVVVTIGLRVANIEGTDELSVYFFAGYSLDSVAGLVLTRFESSADIAQGKLAEQLAPAAPSGEPAKAAGSTA